MGDFYELFFDDAVKASKILNITLTHRGKIADIKIPMAGIPHHAASSYIDRITAQGLKVAICEQTQDAKETIGIVKRAVTQIATPALPFDLDKAEGRESNFISSAYQVGNNFYLASIDFTNGTFVGSILKSVEELIEKIQKITPKEFITFMGQWENFPLVEKLLEKQGILKTHLSEESFQIKHSALYVEKLIPGFKTDKTLDLDKNILSPLSSLSYYITSTQNQETFVHLRPFKLESDSMHMRVTLTTLKGLEIFPKSRESYKDSLLGFFDKTKTSLGSRKLKDFFLHPSIDIKEIKKRQSIISFFLQNDTLLEDVREELTDIRDLERILAKVSTKKVNAGDLINVSRSISIFNDLKFKLKNLPGKIFNSLPSKDLDELKKLSLSINKTINDEIGASLEKGNLIKKGCRQERDRLAKLANNSTDELLALENKYRKETGIPKLRLKTNNIAGYFIEISKSYLKKVPSNFQRRQTLVNSERYTTNELAEFEKDMITAKDKLGNLEREIFKQIIEELSHNAQLILNLASVIGELDVFQSFSWISLQENFTSPILNQEKVLHIKGGWHPLIKSQLKEEFVCHDLALDSDKFFGLITGPNMAGKTTVMREAAIIQLLTQIGSYVPAKEATVGICDYIFSRLGASDDILKGQSTFMVEMSETSEILRHATEHSLIILDEIGRGTSTYDGLSIAWALIEHFITKTKALTLFATHYHELIDVVEELKGGKNLTVETLNHDGDVQFLYRLIEGGAAQSYGIYVAKLAGFPKNILKRSSELLTSFEETTPQDEPRNHPTKNSSQKKAPKPGTQLSFFVDESIPEPKIPAHLLKIEEEIKKLDILTITPLEAFQKLHKLKSFSTIH
jgi:DNA mismatch repair protein MutS